MAPSTITDRGVPAVVTNTAPVRSRLPRRLRILILLVLTQGLKTALWSSVNPILGNELGAISKIPEHDNMLHPLAHLAYNTATIALGWVLDYDYLDIGALTLVANAPYAYLLATYYNISLPTVAAFMNIEVISIALPTFLLRPQSKIHDPNAPLRNRYLINSFQVQTATSLLAVGVYAVVIWSALKSDVLNPFIITHFDIPTLEFAHAETPITIAWKVLTAGVAAKSFLLNPSIGAATGAVTPVHPFDPATATLPETVKQNVWFFTRRTRTLIRQTFILSTFLLANTVQRCLTLQGADAIGAVGYSSVWILATVICAGWWTWVGNTETDIDS
ncbi:hypothetical protein K504DRAFT_461546 [Pleomassaria siparia CBS 279.74]|uniref:Uncharacterized protein n=1 Tax=Pleomassaria siparia CBS 279.74 TaxID=1314801 RepID=A0A6G1KJF0_9PLEO|nr:hypothetical protein K504DRAFT_461546 [Pleomassaria siparia CBS 279.74]